MERKKRVAFLTLGCKVNQYETDAMVQLLENAGYEIVSMKEEADFYIINTCSVTNMAERKSRQMIHKAKKNHPDSTIVAVGCYVQTAAQELKKEYAVDLLVGNNKKKDIVSVLKEYEKGKKKTEVVIDIDHTKEYEALTIQKTMEHTRVYVKIQDGCNQFCSYCLIPYTRGRVRSREKEDILNEVRNLAQNGYQEIVLTGIHISSYGQDLENDNLESLIVALHEIEGIERIRLGSLEPRIITEKFVKTISSLYKVCPHFHLSLQSGCDETLKRMNRKYTTAEYEEACNILRKYYEHPALTTDVIVGFPGETEEEFSKTVEFLERIHLYEMHVFQYSPRRGTRAEKMENQVSPTVKHERSKILLDMTSRQKREYEQFFFGKEEIVLVEEKIAQNNEEYFTGHTKRYLKVYLLSHKNIEKKMIRVKIIGYSNENRLIAETLD
ncbi:MAG: tRNA (N(6)-L-threonylcarbamoyladenosine(37)-C(2))-methylthiotransferase MtaB [Lachnospiraceae bacterium]